MYHTGNIDDAQELVDSLVQIKIPLVQEIQGNLKLLNDNLSVLQKILVLLSHRKTKGMTFEELVESIGKKHSANIRTTLCNLDESGLIYKDKKKNSAYFITLAGEKYVAEKIGFEI
jgi:predicted transcriptional regulator